MLRMNGGTVPAAVLQLLPLPIRQAETGVRLCDAAAVRGCTWSCCTRSWSVPLSFALSSSFSSTRDTPPLIATARDRVRTYLHADIRRCQWRRRGGARLLREELLLHGSTARASRWLLLLLLLLLLLYVFELRFCPDGPLRELCKLCRLLQRRCDVLSNLADARGRRWW